MKIKMATIIFILIILVVTAIISISNSMILNKRESSTEYQVDNLRECEVFDYNQVEELSLFIDDASVTESGLEYIITNNTLNTITVTEDWSVLIELNDKFYLTPTTQVWGRPVDDSGWALKPNSNISNTIDWTWLYGELNRGEYAFLIKVADPSTSDLVDLLLIRFEIK